MMNEKKLFCLECDVLLLRLYDLPDLAAVSRAPASSRRFCNYIRAEVFLY